MMDIPKIKKFASQESVDGSESSRWCSWQQDIPTTKAELRLRYELLSGVLEPLGTPVRPTTSKPARVSHNQIVFAQATGKKKTSQQTNPSCLFPLGVSLYPVNGPHNTRLLAFPLNHLPHLICL